MTTAITPTKQDIGAQLEAVLIQGDLNKLSPEQRIEYYRAVCDSVGLNPLTRPFDYITLQGKLTLYAKKDATDQLRKIHNISITALERETVEGVYVVIAHAMTPQNRQDTSSGAVNIKGLTGDALANALMKAETKAKRRATLSICGLGMLDETEIETIPNVFPQPQPKLVTEDEERAATIESIGKHLNSIPGMTPDFYASLARGLVRNRRREDVSTDEFVAIWNRVHKWKTIEQAQEWLYGQQPASQPSEAPLFTPEDATKPLAQPTPGKPSVPAGGPTATDKQVKAVYAIGKATRDWTADDVKQEVASRYGCSVELLSVAQASQFIEWMKGETK